MASKAGKILTHLQNNELALSFLKAAIKDDVKIFLDAVSKAKLKTDDFTLSDTEMSDFIEKGVTSSGKLELVDWDGYYQVTSPVDSKNPRALLILSSQSKVYWGTPKEIVSEPAKHSVTYSFTTDGKLEFTPSGSDGKVSISMNRTYDDKKGTATAGFSVSSYPIK